MIEHEIETSKVITEMKNRLSELEKETNLNPDYFLGGW